MIYIIGGSPRSGKTIVAKKLSKELSCSKLSIDDLRPVIIKCIPKKELRQKFPFKVMYYGDNDNFYEKYLSGDILKAEITEAKSLWPGVAEFIKNKALSKRDFIIEGVQLLPALVNTLRKEKFWREIKTVYLIRTDKGLILEGIKKNKAKNDWLLVNTKNHKTLERAAEQLSVEGKYLYEEALKYKFKTINTEKNFNQKLKEATDRLIG